MTELLDAVDALTKPSRERVTQEIMKTRLQPDGRPALDGNNEPIRDPKGQQTLTIEHPPLLQQLEDAIASTIGAGAGRSMLSKHALNVLDSDALFKFVKIRSAITDWCRIVNVRATRHAVHDLRAWHAARLATRATDDDWHIEQLRAWAGLIKAKLNPPQTWEIKDPCPICRSATWESEDEQGNPVTLPRPLIVEYHPDRDDILVTAKATCRACGHEWRGRDALRALRWDIDHPPEDETRPEDVAGEQSMVSDMLGGASPPV